MKRLVLLPFMVFLLLAPDASEASLLGIGRSRTKKLHDRKTTEAPYACLDPPINLPLCNFASDEDEKTMKFSRRRRALGTLGSSDPLEDSDELSSVEEPARGYTRALTIVYKIEGCIPSRLPFDVPICKRKDSKGRIVEVRRLFPFKVMGNSEDVGVPLVFPELDMSEWHRFMKGPWTRQATNEGDAENPKIEGSSLSESPSPIRKLPKRKKFEYENWSDKKKLDERSTLPQVSRNAGDDDLFSKFVSTSLMKSQTTKGRAGQINTSKYRRNKSNVLPNEEELDNEISDERVNEKISFNYRDEFPYEKAIPYDPEKLQAARPGSEFPYARAIPYDPKKLQERKDEAMERSLRFYTRRLKVVGQKRDGDFLDVPFDTSMLAAAKEGGKFPYGKETPEDTAKIHGTMESSALKESRKDKVPVGEAVNYWSNEKVPTVTRKLRLTKNEAMVEDMGSIIDLHDTRKNEKMDGEASSRKIQVEDSYQSPRVVRGVIESSTSDVSSVNENYEVPRPWSEFPYSKAIPFDPEKLRRRTRSTHYGNSLLTIPHDFPYASAIPYDPFKFNAIRRNEHRLSDERSSAHEKDRL